MDPLPGPVDPFDAGPTRVLGDALIDDLAPADRGQCRAVATDLDRGRGRGGDLGVGRTRRVRCLAPAPDAIGEERVGRPGQDRPGEGRDAAIHHGLELATSGGLGRVKQRDPDGLARTS